MFCFSSVGGASEAEYLPHCILSCGLFLRTQGSAEIALQSAMSVTADRLHETFLDRMAGRKRDTELAHDSTVRSQLGCSGLGPGWEWLQDDLVEAFGERPRDGASASAGL